MHRGGRQRRRSRYPLRPYTRESSSRALVRGHSFIARLGSFLDSNMDFRVSHNFDFDPSLLEVRLQGEGGRTVDSVREHDLSKLDHAQPHIIHLELGTNDLCDTSRERFAIASRVVSLVDELHYRYGVFFINVGQVTPRVARENRAVQPADFNERAFSFNGHIRELLELRPFAKYWSHRRLWRAASDLYLPRDGIHYGPLGNFRLYKSIG